MCRGVCVMQSNDKDLAVLMRDIHAGRIQLPDFQRGWIWDDDRIRGLIASITRNFPVGAVMFLPYGGDSLRFKYRLFEGVSSADSSPSDLVLDGQQRLTSAYSALYGEGAVRTRTDKGKEIYRWYYISIEQALNADADRLDAITSVPKTKQVTSDFGRKVELDLTTAEKEYEAKMFPLNIILDPTKTFQWEQAYLAHYGHEADISKEYSDFKSRIVMPVFQYKIPVITLEKDTPKEAISAQIVLENFSFSFGKNKANSAHQKRGRLPSFLVHTILFFLAHHLQFLNDEVLRPEGRFSLARLPIFDSSQGNQEKLGHAFLCQPSRLPGFFYPCAHTTPPFRPSPANSFVTSGYRDNKSNNRHN